MDIKMTALKNKGALFNTPDKSYEMSGSIMIENTEYQLFVYKATSKSGKEYYQLSAYITKGDHNGMHKP